MLKRTPYFALIAVFLSAASLFAGEFNIDDIGQVKSSGVRHVTAKEAFTIIEGDSEIIVLDVRTPPEFNRANIKGAVNINYYSFSFKKKLEALDKTKTYLVHCATGVRSGRTLPIMLEAGFTNIIHMDGGFRSWSSIGLPVQR